MSKKNEIKVYANPQNEMIEQNKEIIRHLKGITGCLGLILGTILLIFASFIFFYI